MPTQYLPVSEQLPRVRAFLTEVLPSRPGAGKKGPAVGPAAGPALEAILGELTGVGVSAWAAITGGQVRAVFAAALRHVEVGDPEYTYMPARYALVSMSRWHVRADADWAYAPDLLDHIARDAARAGIERLSIDIPVDQGRAMRTLLDAGFTPDVILAARPTCPGSGADLPGVRIRTARDDDAPALLALTLEEADYHAAHTRSGIRANQDPGPSQAHVAAWLENQRTRNLPTLVAEVSGRVVGMLPLVQIDGEGPAHVPENYGYVASTCITASARGRGIGTALVERALGAAHERGIAMLLLHYIADNPTAQPFWTARGFSPITVTLTRHPAPETSDPETSDPETSDPETSAEVWEERYAAARVWSGKANPALVQHAGDLEPGTALDLGSGEGADALWLAGRGWRVTGVDVSATALARAEAHAAERGVSLTWVEADLADWVPETTYDLVTSFFLHSPVHFPRALILRSAAAAVAPGGVLLVVGHASFPPWSRHHHEPGERPGGAGGSEGAPRFPTVAETIAEAELGRGWDLLVAENLPREVTGPEGQRATILDSVVKARRRP